MNFIWFEDFLSLAATGSFSRAAEERHSSQSAFSRRIRALEEWVGHDLFDRTTQPARLTEVGEWFEQVAKDMIAKANRIPLSARIVAEASAATLRIASTHALSFTFLPEWIRSLESHTTLGPVQLASDVLQQCERLLLQGKVQFVLSHAHASAPGPLDANAYRSMVVGHDVLVPVSKPDTAGKAMHPLSTATGSLPVPVPLLEYSEASGLGRMLRDLLGRKMQSVALQPVFTAHLASVLRTMALDGRGLAWLPHKLVADDLQAGRLVEAAENKEWTVPLAIKLYYDSEHGGSAAEALWGAAKCSAHSINAHE